MIPVSDLAYTKRCSHTGLLKFLKNGFGIRTSVAAVCRYRKTKTVANNEESGFRLLKPLPMLNKKFFLGGAVNITDLWKKFLGSLRPIPIKNICFSRLGC